MTASPWVALALTLISQSAAPAKPDFNGRWIAVSPKQVEGQTLTIAQTDATVRIQLVYPGGEQSTLYFLDGELRKSDLHGNRVSAKWDKDKLVLVDVSLTMGYYPVRRAISLNRDGELVVELIAPYNRPDGEGSTYSNAAAEPRRAVFKRYN